MHHLRAGKAMGGGLDDLQFLNDSLTGALDLFQPLRRGREDPVEIPETVQKRAGQRLDVLTRDRAEEDKLKQLIIRHRGGTTRHEAGAKALPMVADIRGQAHPWQRQPGRLIGVEEG